jgi:PKD repeat protein
MLHLSYLVFRKYYCFLLFFILLISFSFANAQYVTLKYPADGYVTSKYSIELCWDLQYNTSYEVEVSLTNDFSSIFYTANNIISNKLIVTNLNPNTVYFWHVRSTSPTLSQWSNIFSFKQFSPNSLSGLSLWLKADSAVTFSNGNVLTWKDLSPNQYSLTQATVTNQPTRIQTFCNNNFAINFDGNDILNIPNYTFGLSNTIFMVVKKNGGIYQARYLGTYGNGMEMCAEIVGFSGNVIATYETNKPSLLTAVRASANSMVMKNDSIIGVSTAALTPLTTGALAVGKSTNSSQNEFITGEIGEIIICGVELDDSLINLTNRYLMDKFSSDLNIGNDTVIMDNYCPITIGGQNTFINYLWSTGDTTATININKSGTYWLQVKDYFGRLSTDTIHIQFPVYNQINSQPLCSGNSLTWSTGLGNSYSHQWQDNSNQNQFTISNAGQYYFTITDSYGCTFTSDTVSISIDNFATENNLGNDTSMCAGNTVQLINNSVSATSFLWSTGSLNDTIPVFNTGQYWVEISNINNCIFRDTIYITITGVAPQPAFSALDGCIGAPINFTDLSVPAPGETIVQWEWNFADSTFSSIQNNLHTYAEAGSYLVNLKVISQTGCGALVNQIVNVFKAPELSYLTFNMCNDKLTKFENTSNLFGGSQQSVLWNFGDTPGLNNSSNNNLAFHSYDTAGSYLVKLTLITIEGCIDSVETLINIKPSPIANFTATNLCIGQATVFSDISQIDFPWQNLSRTWFFTNNDTSHLYQPSYVFDTAGVFPITLFTQSSNGCSDTITKLISVYNLPEAHLTFDKNCLGSTTQFTDSSICVNCQIDSYHWFLNDELVSENPGFNYLFGDTGTYLVKLEVLNNAGCSAFIDTSITITPAPISNFTINSSFGSPPFDAVFTNLSLNSNSYYWEFGDGSFSSSINPSHTFNDTGNYTIQLTAFSNDNCISKSNQTLKIIPKRIDILAFKLETELVNNYLESTLIVFNQSSTIISGFEINITNKSNTVLKENYTNNILPGEFKTIKLNTKILQGEGNSASDVLCIDIVNINEGIDENQSNNMLCNTFDSDQFKLLNIYPNPSKDNIIINFISPTSEDVSYQIYDLTGNKLVQNIINAKQGFNQHQIETNSLAVGSYICKLSNNKTTKSLMFIKLNKD